MKKTTSQQIVVGSYVIKMSQEVKDSQSSTGKKKRQYNIKVYDAINNKKVKSSYYLTKTDRNTAVRMLFATLEYCNA
ncbi:hypothetical protein N5U17_06155 [Aliarcobacter butzleri]|uniref:hypothetical protein n=1 Tax=Aliarcobacter butzleri TaxID=28197 RepID=UPI0021B18793|nr:hypothetical protein [Aliarcobacter butzleri]MCT7603812.1 hypothetical protein [Aliarcobacter butzleri]